METLRTAEGVTRFLRAKGGSLDEIILIANQTLDETINVYLPNKHIFVFDLLCDRLNDNNHFKDWKYNSQCWVLFKKVWTSLNQDKKSRNRAMKKFKLIDVLTNILKNPKQQGPDLLHDVFEVTDIVIKDYYIEIEDNSSIGLLASYVTTLNYLHDTTNYNDKIINYWTGIIYKIFQIPLLNIDHKYNKKSIAKFFGEVLPPALHFINAKKNDDILSETNSILQNIICKVLFHKESSDSLKGNIDTLLSKSANNISFDSVKYLFALIINNLSSKDMKLCEALFLLIINTKKFNKMSETLLEILSNVNKSLSTEFFASIYEKEVKSNTSNNINWSLVIHLFKLDIELAINNVEEILMNMPKTVDLETKIKIGESVADAYIRAREFIDFFKHIWLKLIHKSSIWESFEFIDIISLKINSLSSSQLSALLGFLFDQKDALPLVTSVIKGLIMCPLSKTEAVKNIVLTQNKYFTEKSDNYWELRFYICCLYEEVIERNTEFMSFVTSSPACPSRYYFYTIFRLIELSGEDNSFGTYQVDFIRYLQNLKSQILPEMLIDILNRWLIIINNFFSKDQTYDIILMCFNSLKFEVIESYFNDNGDIFFEQKNLTDALIVHSIEALKEENADSINFIKLCSLIPIQCFDKYSKKKLINSLFETFSGHSNDDINFTVRVTLKHLLVQPSFKSSLELDFKYSLKLIETSIGPAESLSSEIVQSIWMQHLAQYNLESNKDYIIKSIKYLNKVWDGYKLNNDKKLPPEFQASLIIISTNPKGASSDEKFQEMLQTLSSKFTKTTEDVLFNIVKNNNVNYNTVCCLLKYLHLTIKGNYDHTETTVGLIKKIGLKLSDSQSDHTNEVRVVLFQLLTSVSKPNLKNAIFILTLFVSLDLTVGYNKSNDMEEFLMIYLSKFATEDEEFKMLYYFVLQSANMENDPTNMASLVKLINCLIRSLSKNNQSECITLFIKALSVFLTKYNLISLCGHHSIISILSTLKSTLSDMTWCFNQYALETTISLITRISVSLKEPEFVNNDDCVETYIQLTQVMSRILLFHRFKLSSRHHVVVNLFASLLKPLSLKSHMSSNLLSSSVSAANAYSRLLSNLCEPSNVASKDTVQLSLNSTSALIKRSLRQHLPVLVLNYIHIALKDNFASQVNDELISGIFSIFSVLSQSEIRLVSSSLDIPGKTYYRSLYADYKEHGKWKDQ